MDAPPPPPPSPPATLPWGPLILTWRGPLSSKGVTPPPPNCPPCSRSATLCAAYLMRKRLWTCHQAMTHVVECRSIADPNEGFVGCLHALGTALGVSAGGPAAKAGAAEAMVGEKVVVREVGDGGKKDRRREEPRHGRHDRDRERDRGRDGRREERKRGRSRSRSPERGAPECAGAGEAFLVLEVVKDGKVVSKLEIPELKPNQRCAAAAPLTLPPPLPPLAQVHGRPLKRRPPAPMRPQEPVL